MLGGWLLSTYGSVLSIRQLILFFDKIAPQVQCQGKSLLRRQVNLRGCMGGCVELCGGYGDGSISVIPLKMGWK